MAKVTSPEALALSQRNFELAKKNQHHHHLGPGGYDGKDELFRKIEQDVAASGSFNLQGLPLRS